MVSASRGFAIPSTIGFASKTHEPCHVSQNATSGPGNLNISPQNQVAAPAAWLWSQRRSVPAAFLPGTLQTIP
jgi:hypothetical protein